MKSAAFSPEWLARRLAELLPAYPEVSLCIAFSGGVDSVALLAACATALRGRVPLRAVHVHHGLHSNADAWARHCKKLARALRVPLKVIPVQVARARGSSLEAAAREARYAALAKAMTPGEILLTAHHQDDQLETVLLQLFRGAGVAGLAAMPELTEFASGHLARPLLTRSRAELEGWTRARQLPWVDDDTNADEHLDRNYLRRAVLPLVRARWPSAAAAVSRSARHAAEAKQLLDTLARADVERSSSGAALSVTRLRVLDRSRRKNALRYWIDRAGFALPDSRRLDEIAGPLLVARGDANPSVRWNEIEVQRHADRLTIGYVANAPAAADRIEWNWRPSPRLELDAFRGALDISPDDHGPIDLDKLPAQLVVRQRQGGEKLRSAGGRTRTVKAILQEARVPPAERQRIPLIFSGDQLLAVADLWSDASIRATGSSLRRGRIRWRG